MCVVIDPAKHTSEYNFRNVNVYPMIVITGAHTTSTVHPPVAGRNFHTMGCVWHYCILYCHNNNNNNKFQRIVRGIRKSFRRKQNVPGSKLAEANCFFILLPEYYIIFLLMRSLFWPKKIISPKLAIDLTGPSAY